jgi:hypothetical protein
MPPDMFRSDSTDLALEFVAINDYLRAGGEPQSALQRLVQLAVGTVPGCDWAAITAWPEGKAPRSLVGSDDIAIAADQSQYDVGDGPCLVAAADSELVRAPDLTAESRWEPFVKTALRETPVRGVLSFHLADQPARTALNLYSGTARAFDEDAVSVAALFAAHARVLLIHATSSEKAANLAVALATSRQIGAAIGILMSAHKITADEAFDRLRVSSQHLHRKLHDIAYEVTETGALPEQV